MTLQIDPTFAERLFPLAPEQRDALEASLLAEGCRDPLVTWRGILLDGHHRHKICTEHDIPFETVEVDLADHDEALAWIDKNQIARRNPSDEAYNFIIGRHYNRAKAAHGGDRRSKGHSGPLNSTAERIANVYTKSPRTVKRHGAFAEKVEADPRLLATLREGRPVGKEIARIEAEERARALAEWQKSPEARMPQGGPYDLGLADNPWLYTNDPGAGRSPEAHYPTQSNEWLRGMELPEFARDAIMFEWATAPLLPEAFRVMEARGFRYVTNIVWDKTATPGDDRKASPGMGRWARIDHEHLLVGVRGNMKPPPPQLIQSSILRERKREHSRKPDAVYEMIERAYPRARKVELFQRGVVRPGWDAWGFEAGKPFKDQLPIGSDGNEEGPGAPTLRPLEESMCTDDQCNSNSGT